MNHFHSRLRRKERFERLDRWLYSLGGPRLWLLAVGVVFLLACLLGLALLSLGR